MLSLSNNISGCGQSRPVLSRVSDTTPSEFFMRPSSPIVGTLGVARMTIHRGRPTSSASGLARGFVSVAPYIALHGAHLSILRFLFSVNTNQYQSPVCIRCGFGNEPALRSIIISHPSTPTRGAGF